VRTHAQPNGADSVKASTVHLRGECFFTLHSSRPQICSPVAFGWRRRRGRHGHLQGRRMPAVDALLHVRTTRSVWQLSTVHRLKKTHGPASVRSGADLALVQAVIADLQSIGQFRQVIAPPTRSAAPNALPVGALALPSRKACSMLDVGKHKPTNTLSTRTDGPSFGHKEHVSRHVFLDCISMFVANKCSWGQVGLHPIGDALRRSGNCAHAYALPSRGQARPSERAARSAAAVRPA